MAEMGGFEQRVRWLEAAARNLASTISDILKRLANVEQRSLVPSGGGSGGNSSSTLFTFWTTSAITSATVTGTLVSNAVRTQGFGTARPCKKDGSQNDIPDTTASDVTIYNNVVMTTPSSINTGLFVDCASMYGRWVVVNVHKCPF